MDPATRIYADGGFDPFTDDTPIESLPDFSLLYTTLRKPAGEDDRERFYTNDRGKALLAGVARVEVGRKDFTWEEARRVSLAKNRPDRYPLEVTEVRDLGVIESSIFTPKALLETDHDVPERFAISDDRRAHREVESPEAARVENHLLCAGRGTEAPKGTEGQGGKKPSARKDGHGRNLEGA